MCPEEWLKWFVVESCGDVVGLVVGQLVDLWSVGWCVLVEVQWSA